ncbi:MAG: M23 family metallopeptidase [Janthinobacterium lividum]
MWSFRWPGRRSARTGTVAACAARFLRALRRMRAPGRRGGARCALGVLAVLLIVVASSVVSSVVSPSRLGITAEPVTRVLPFASDDVAAQQTALARLPAQYVAVTTLAHGEDIDAALRRLNLADPALQRTLRRDARARLLRTLGAGDDIQLRYDERRRLRALVVQIEDPASGAGAAAGAIAGSMAGSMARSMAGSMAGPAAGPVRGTRRIVVERAASGRFILSESFRPYDVYWRSRSGVIGTGFFTSMARAEVPGQIVAETLRLFRDRIDFRHGFQPGDAFRLVHEQLASDMGLARPGRILAVELQARGSWHRAIWHQPAQVSGIPWRDAAPVSDSATAHASAPTHASATAHAPTPATLPAVTGAGAGRYLTFEGVPLHAEPAWQMPVQTAGAIRVSSSFGIRLHPLSGDARHHEGVDLAAPRGTPVVAAAAGTIAFAGWRNGYGRLLVIRHAPPHSTYYAHLDSFAPGIREGRRVARGEAIAEVGSTGGATGPHLHFELRIADQPVDPSPALRQPATATALRGDALRAFRHAARPLLAQIARLRTLFPARES